MAESNSPETHFWLLRHPEPEAAAAGRCYGSLDLKLSETGIRQAHAIARALSRVPFAAIYSSLHQRCTEAAHILAAGRTCSFTTIDSLRELDFGECEGRSYDEIATLYPEIYRQWMERPTEVQFPGGESFIQMRVRVIPAVDDLLRRHAGQSVALITHGGVIRIILAEALGIAATNIFRLGQRYAAVNLIRYFEGFPIVDLMNANLTSTGGHSE
jgi:alpha-ribazole phosphatase